VGEIPGVKLVRLNGTSTVLLRGTLPPGTDAWKVACPTDAAVLLEG
jgi:hypothetical protein